MPTANTSLRSLSQEIRSRLELARDLPARLERPNLPAARESAAAFWDCFHAFSAHAKLGSATARAIDFEALYRSFDAFLAFRAGDSARTTSALLEAWASTSLAEPCLQATADALRRELESAPSELADSVPSERAKDVPPDLGKSVPADLAKSVPSELAKDVPTELAESGPATAKAPAESSDYGEWLVVFHQAVEQIVASELGGDQARAALRSLMARLELSQDDLGRMFGVSGETIRRWERGLTAIPAERRSEILAAESGLRRLQDVFRPERLPTVIRRPAELFDGESALAWILRGRVVEVADRYEKALLYQA